MIPSQSQPSIQKLFTRFLNNPELHHQFSRIIISHPDRIAVVKLDEFVDETWFISDWNFG